MAFRAFNQERRKGSIALVMICALFPVVTSAADTIEGEVKELEGLKVQQTRLLNDIAKADDAVTPKQKEINLWNAELNGSLKTQQGSLEKRKNEFNESQSRLIAAQDAFNASCVGRMPTHQYNACAQKKAGLEQWDATLGAKKGPLERDLRDFNVRVQNTRARRDALVSQVEGMQKQSAELRKQLNAAEARIKVLLGSISAQCKEPGLSAEAIKYCSSVAWDKANPDLGALRDNPVRGMTITPNQ